jgi:DNA modification methylase
MIYLGDYRTEIKRVESWSVACVITSPPFWTAHGGAEWGGELHAWTYIERVVVLATALRRVLRPTSTLWLVLGSRVPWATLHALTRVDWHVSDVSVWETSVVAQLHRSPEFPLEVSDPYAGVITDQPYTPLHPRFVRQCIEQCTDEGDLVLDPCCGTGTVGVEAEALHRRFVGIEIDPASFAFAQARTAPVLGVHV